MDFRFKITNHFESLSILRQSVANADEKAVVERDSKATQVIIGFWLLLVFFADAKVVASLNFQLPQSQAVLDAFTQLLHDLCISQNEPETVSPLFRYPPV
jgi:hypothetical protein